MSFSLKQRTRAHHILKPTAWAVASVVASTPVWSQQIQTLSPVQVTATKIEEPLLGTPQSITVLTSTQIESFGIKAPEELTPFVPNLKLDSGYGAGSRGFLSIRGVGNTPGSMDPSASIYVDDVPYHDFMTYAQPLFDVKQVEVLKGSQGTLYGGFAQAGVIDIRSNLPGQELKRSVSFDLFSPQNTRAAVSLSGPVNDRLSLGVSVLDERGESFIKNVTLGKNSDRAQNAIRLQGVLRPDAETEAVLTVMHHRQRNDGGSDYMPVSRATYNSTLPAGVSTGKFEIANDIEGYQNLDTHAQSLRLKKLASGVEYTVVAANRETKSNSLVDFNYTPTDSGLYASSSVDKITNQYFETRARLLPAGSGAADITVGYSWMKQKYDVNNVASTSNFGGFTGTYDLIKAKGSNNSVFANGRFPINKNGLSVIGGLRYEKAERFGQNGPSDFRSAPQAPFFWDGIVQPTTVESSQTTWKLGVSNILSNGADLYTHVATGWRPAAVNYYAEGPNPRTVDKEKSITYEAGYRHATNSQYFAAAVFLTKVNDYQETKYGPNPGTGYLANVAKVEIPGFEIEGRQAVNKALTVFGGLGYTRARYDRYAEFRNLEGKALGNRPDWNLHMGGAYKVGPMTYAATVVGTSSFYSAYTSSGETTKIDGHLIGNLRATYQAKNYSISAYVNNIADKEYFLNAGYYNYGASQPRGQVGSPRTFGVTLKADF